MPSPSLRRRIACELTAAEAGQTLVTFLSGRFTYRNASGWRAECELFNVEEGLPEAAYESIQGWRLGEFRVRIYDGNGKLAGEQSVRKLVKDEDVGYEAMGGAG